MPFFENGDARIYYEEVDSGTPLLIIAGGGLNSTIWQLNNNSPFNPLNEFSDEAELDDLITVSSIDRSLPVQGVASPTTLRRLEENADYEDPERHDADRRTPGERTTC